MLILLGTYSYCDNPRVVVDNGHTGVVRSLEYHQEFDLLFSSGEDGTVRGWNASTKELVYNLRVSYNPIEKFALDPEQPRIATVEKVDAKTFKLAVWNWQDNKELFSREIREVPLYIGFSPKGSYLAYSITEWDSLVLLDAESGEQTSYLRDGFGIVSGFIISPSEKTIMTYSPSGNIQYWDIVGGFRKQRISTTSDITTFSFTSNLRYMVGSDGNRVYMIDLINGNEVVSLPISGIGAVSTNPLSNSVACVARREAEEDQTIFLIDLEDRIRIERRFDVPFEERITDVAFYMNSIYTSNVKGYITEHKIRWSTHREFGTGRLKEITDIAFTKDQLLLPSKEEILVFNSDFLKKTKKEEDKLRPEYVYITKHPNPFQEKIGIETVSDRDLLLWTKGESAGKIAYFNPFFSSSGNSYEDFESPLKDISIDSTRILALEKNGTCRIFDKDTFHEKFSYSSFGLETVTFAGDAIIAGKSRSTGFSVPLLQINPETGETVPIYDSNVLTFDLMYDDNNRRLYSLGLQQEGETFSTVLKEHTGRTFDLTYTLQTFKGEDLGAAFTMEQRPTTIYSTIGYNGIEVFPFSQETVFEKSGHVPRKIVIHGRYLFSLNRDSTVTAWDKNSGDKLFDLYLFKDSNWLVVLPSGHHYSSSGARQYINFYDGSQRYRGDTSSFRLNEQTSQSSAGSYF